MLIKNSKTYLSGFLCITEKPENKHTKQYSVRFRDADVLNQGKIENMKIREVSSGYICGTQNPVRFATNVCTCDHLVFTVIQQKQHCKKRCSC